MKLLFCKPGALTQEYFKGKITSYVHPLKMNMFLLVIVIAIFALTVETSSDSSISADFEANLKGTFQTYLPMTISSSPSTRNSSKWLNPSFPVS